MRKRDDDDDDDDYGHVEALTTPSCGNSMDS